MPVLISEVGPRDGLQMLAGTMPTADKCAWIGALYRAGLREIEVGSFVPARVLPQMADTAAVCAAARALPGLTVAVLAPNERGVADALAAGAHKITVPISVSDAHSRANVRMSTDEAADAFARASRLVAGLPPAQRPVLEAGLSTAFGCHLSGPVPEDRVIEIAERCARAGADEVGLSDTTGYGNPAQVKRLFTRLRTALGERAGGAHFHNTRGLGLANVLAAYEAGVRTFDGSQAGLGGCPFAPGASGNVVTEDMVFMFESMGIDTGIDLPRLIAAREILSRAFPDEPLHGMVPLAGLPLGFSPAHSQACRTDPTPGCAPASRHSTSP
ncbi:MAG: hydroxymethylglutaryl-CoA lyase [Burkholderiaceae bacterium]